MTSVLIALGLAFSVIAGPDEQPAGITWPNGAKAAIALTYDDSLDSQLDNALPALEAAGLKGTFFLTIGRPGFYHRVDEWAAVAADGHELANHMLFHPCRGSLPGRDWVSPDADLDTYNIERVVSEVTLTNHLLHNVDGQEIRTFAYPCGDAIAGGESYIEAIKPLFIAARGVSRSSSWHTDKIIDPYTVSTLGPDGHSGKDLIEYVESVVEAGGLGTITFHGVGAEYLSVSNEAHEELLSYLAAHDDEIWIDTFRNIMLYVNEQQAE